MSSFKALQVHVTTDLGTASYGACEVRTPGGTQAVAGWTLCFDESKTLIFFPVQHVRRIEIKAAE